MKRATSIPGETYCLEHQGNHSHYDPRNCTVCQLVAALQAAVAFADAAYGYRDRPDYYVAARAAIANLGRDNPRFDRERFLKAAGVQS